jgi:hypothetical protein
VRCFEDVYFIWAKLPKEIFVLNTTTAAVGTLLAHVLNLKATQQVSNIYFYVSRDKLFIIVLCNLKYK